MLLQLKSLFTGERSVLPLDAQLDFSALEFQGLFPFKQPVKITGAVVCSTDVVTLHAKALFVFDGRCDRCLEDFRRCYEIPMEHILVTSLNNEENDDFLLLKNYQLSLDDLAYTDILLELPSKILCKETCRGLCLMCGKDLNEGLCGCHNPAVDPRFEVLRQLID